MFIFYCLFFTEFYFVLLSKNVTFANELYRKGTAKLIKMIKTLLFSVLIIAICIVLLSVRIIFKKNGKFGQQDVKDNPRLQKEGVHCTIDQDREARIAGKAC